MASAGDVESEVSYPDFDILSVIGRPNLDLWKSSPDISVYLQELSSYGVQRLAQEPERLAEEKSAVLEQTQELAFHNYKTFIQTAQCSRDIFKEFSVIENRLESLQDKLPEFGEKCQSFSGQAQQIIARWHQTSLTLSKHPQLLEVLELSQLMDTCVRNNYYDEALELAAYVRRLEKKYSSIPLIASIASEVQESQHLMLTQLLQQLRSAIQLPACLKVIGYLRRMDVFSEAELRIKFLQARGSWFQHILNNIPNTDAYTHITKVIEACRVHLFDIITQYRAIFSDDDPLLTLSSRESNEPAIFYSWITSRVSEFLRILQEDLEKDVGGRIDSILSQCMYFGLSFSRVGADFRPLLVPLFQNAILSRFNVIVKESTERFLETMQSFTLTSLPSVGPAAMLMSSLTTEENLQPPFSLLEFNPLAHYCNGILGAFNELRLCACLSIVCNITATLKQSLAKVVTCIVDFHIAEESTMTPKEQETFLRFCTAFGTDLVPFLDKCLGVLFPNTQLGKILGVPATVISKMDNMGRLDVSKILEPMSHLLAVKEEEEEDSFVEKKPTEIHDVQETKVAPEATVEIDSVKSESTPEVTNANVLDLPAVSAPENVLEIRKDDSDSVLPVSSDNAISENVSHPSESQE